jgi:hypothetical protein
MIVDIKKKQWKKLLQRITYLRTEEKQSYTKKRYLKYDKNRSIYANLFLFILNPNTFELVLMEDESYTISTILLLGYY